MLILNRDHLTSKFHFETRTLHYLVLPILNTIYLYTKPFNPDKVTCAFDSGHIPSCQKSTSRSMSSSAQMNLNVGYDPLGHRKEGDISL